MSPAAPFLLCGQQSALDWPLKAKGVRAAGFSIGDLHDKPQVRQWDPRQRPPGVIASPAEPWLCLPVPECASLRRCGR